MKSGTGMVQGQMSNKISGISKTHSSFFFGLSEVFKKKKSIY